MKISTLSFVSLWMVGILFTCAAISPAQKRKRAESTASLVSSTTLVLSQVYGGGGGASGTYINDYVEIKNVSASSQSLNGLSLMYGSATGQFGSSAGNIFALPNISIQPGQYFLVQLGSSGSGGAALPVSPDATTTNLSMSGTSGKVALVTSSFTANTCGATATPCSLPNANIIDLVSYGTSNDAEGGVTVNNGTALSSTLGAVRKLSGCQDTDSNNNDFDVVTAPVPRNSSTTLPCGSTHTQHVSDYDGDGKTDFAIVRDLGPENNNQLQWWVLFNGTLNTGAVNWGLSNVDTTIPADFDGDGKTDVSVWRSNGDLSAFYILQSHDNTFRGVTFGLDGDDPSVVADYDGDGKADPAVFRDSLIPGQQTWFYFLGSNNNPAGNITYVPWGISFDLPAPGDYDGDGKGDFVIVRDDGTGHAIFWSYLTGGGITAINYGLSSDIIAPGDYDGDGKTDLAVVRWTSGSYEWYYRPSSTGAISAAPAAIWGLNGDDDIVQGDYDGDGKTDFAIYRKASSVFWVRTSGGAQMAVPFGLDGDAAPAAYNTR